MLDYKFIRDNIGAIKQNIKNRNVQANPELVVGLYNKRNTLCQKIDDLRNKRNLNARKMKERLTSKQRQKLITEGKELKKQIMLNEELLRTQEKQLIAEASKIPNMCHRDVPQGEKEDDNKELKRWGNIPAFEFKPLDHIELAQRLDLIDFEGAAKVSGNKFYFLKNEAVFLELALTRYTLDILTDRGFVPTITPDIAREEVLEGIGFNPRGEESNIYRLEKTGTCLIATAEITLGGYYTDTILKPEELPIKLAGLSHCFRREAGAAGQYSKGLYRVHQFSKVEMFIFCLPQESEKWHQQLLDIEEKIYQGLDIPYRVVDVCSGDLGNPAYRKFDIEAWLPGRGEQGDWGEITSTSNCTDYQARRLGIRYKKNDKSVFVHMLNGTAVAVSRSLIAILENNQQQDGSVKVPAALVPYTGFSLIKPRH